MGSRKWMFLILAGVILLSVSCGLPKLVWPAQQTATAVVFLQAEQTATADVYLLAEQTVSGYEAQSTEMALSTESSVFDLLGSTWHVVYDNPKFGHVEYDIKFNSGGSLYNNHTNEVTPDNDFWQQDGYVVILTFNNSYAIYSGILSADGTYMEGTASSDSGGDWTWYAERTSP